MPLNPNIGNALAGMGAGLSGQGVQWQQQQLNNRQEKARMTEQELAARQQAFFGDMLKAKQMADAGDYVSGAQLFANRMEALRFLGNAENTDDTRIVGQLFNIAATGKPEAQKEAQDRLQKTLGNYLEYGQAMGFVKAGESGNEGAKRTDVFKSGHVLQSMKDGSLRLTDPSGRQVSPDNWQAEMRAASKSGIGYAADEAGARASGDLNARMGLEPTLKGANASETARQTAIVNTNTDRLEKGLVAASMLPELNRASALVDKVSTGGLSKAAAEAQAMLGVLPANETELYNLLTKNVLSSLRTTFGPQFTEKDREAYAEMEAGYGKSNEGNKRILKNAISMMKSKADWGIKAAKILGDDMSLEEINSYMDMDLAKQQQSLAQPAPTQPAPATVGIKFLGFE